MFMYPKRQDLFRTIGGNINILTHIYDEPEIYEIIAKVMVTFKK